MLRFSPARSRALRVSLDAGLVAIVALFLGLSGWVAARLYGPENTVVSREALELLSEHIRTSLFNPEPRERFLFLMLLGLLPLGALGVLRIRARLERGSKALLETPSRFWGRAVWVVDLALALTPAGVIWATWAGDSWGAMFGAVLFAKLAWGALALAVILALIAESRASRDFLFRGKNRGILALAVGVMAGAILAFRVVGADDLDLGSRWKVHFDPVLFPVNQIVHGGTSLVDVFPQYGLYGELLAPLFRVLPWSVFSFTAVFAGLLWLSYAALAAVVVRHVKNRVWLLASLVALMPLLAGIFYPANQGPGWDLYVQYYPVRIIFPAIGVWWVGRSARLARLPALTAGFLAGIAIVWNIDSGVPVFGAFIALFGSRALWSPKPLRRLAWRALGLMIAAAGAVLALTWCYLVLKSGHLPQIGASLDYQRLFYTLGLGMLPMPGLAHPWIIVVLTYVTGFVLSLLALGRRRRNPIWETVLFLSVLGLGLFAYYQGRSHNAVLIAVVWPAAMIGALLGDRCLRAIRAGLLARHWTVTPMAVAFVFVLLGVRWLEQGPSLVATARANWRPQAQHLILREDVDFIRKYASDENELDLFTDDQAACLTEAGLRAPGGSPGLVELLTRTQLEALLRRLDHEPRRRIFAADQFSFYSFPDFDADLRRILATRYRSVAVSGSGLRYYELRADPARPKP